MLYCFTFAPDVPTREHVYTKNPIIKTGLPISKTSTTIVFHKGAIKGLSNVKTCQIAPRGSWTNTANVNNTGVVCKFPYYVV